MFPIQKYNKIKIDEKINISKAGRKIGSGTSEEYNIGSSIYSECSSGKFIIGCSTFFPNDINSKAILSRLARLNKQNNTDFKYATRSEVCLIESLEGVRVGKGFKIAVEGFRIHRVK